MEKMANRDDKENDNDADGEITPEALAALNVLLDQGPGDDASEEEVEAFMKKFAETPGGSAMLQSLTDQLAEGGGELLREVMGQDLLEGKGSEPDWSLYRKPVSPLRLVYRIEPVASPPLSWRRLTLPSDASFFDLHLALEDAFALEGTGSHRFEWRENGQAAATFLSGPSEVLVGDDYCEFQNRPLDLFGEGATRLSYRQEGAKSLEFALEIEKMIEPSGGGGSGAGSPQCLGGAGPEPDFDPKEIEFRQPGPRSELGAGAGDVGPVGSVGSA